MMNRRGIPQAPKVKDWEGMNIINSIMYFKEVLKREHDIEQKEIYKRKLTELKAQLQNYKVA